MSKLLNTLSIASRTLLFAGVSFFIVIGSSQSVAKEATVSANAAFPLATVPAGRTPCTLRVMFSVAPALLKQREPLYTGRPNSGDMTTSIAENVMKNCTTVLRAVVTEVGSCVDDPDLRIEIAASTTPPDTRFFTEPLAFRTKLYIRLLDREGRLFDDVVCTGSSVSKYTAKSAQKEPGVLRAQESACKAAMEIPATLDDSAAFRFLRENPAFFRLKGVEQVDLVSRISGSNFNGNEIGAILLGYAIRTNNLALCELMLQSKVSMEARIGSTLTTPLMIAESLTDLEAFECFARAGVSLYSMNGQRLRALIATSSERLSCYPHVSRWLNDSLKEMSASEADEWMCLLVKTSNRVLIDISFEQFGRKAHGTNGPFLERAVLAAVQANDLDLAIKLLDVGGSAELSSKPQNYFLVESDAPLFDHKKGGLIRLEVKGRYTDEPFFPPSSMDARMVLMMNFVSTSYVKLAEWRGGRVLTELKLSGSKVVNAPGPLMYAVINGNPRMVQRLLEAGADPDLAITISSSEKELIVRLLPETRRDAYIQTEDLSCSRIVEGTVKGTVLSMSSSPDSRFKHNVLQISPRDLAREKGDQESLAAMAAAEIDPEIKRADGSTQLMVAADRGNVETVRILLQKNAAVNATNKLGATALFFAAQKGHLEAVKTLLGNGAAVDTKILNGATPMCIAAERGHREVVSALLQQGAAIELSDNHQCTPLWMAAAKGHANVVNLLLEKGAAIEAVNDEGATPLYISVSQGHSGVVKALLACSAAVEAKSKSGATPLICAIQTGSFEIVQMLLSAGANPKVEWRGQTPLALAKSGGLKEIATALRKAGAK